MTALTLEDKPRTRAEVRALFRRRDRYRSPAWRFERIDDLLNTPRGRPSPRVDDDYIRNGFSFIRAWRRFDVADYESEDDREGDRQGSLYLKNHGLYHAYDDYDRESNLIPRKWMEAWLLTGLDNDRIADEIETYVDHVDWYEALFFNVRDRLGNEDWISEHALKLNPKLGLNGYCPGDVFKFFAYHAGPIMLRVLRTHYDKHLGKHGSNESADNLLASYVKHRIIARGAESVDHFDINQWNIERVLEMVLQAIQLAHQIAEQRGKIDQAGEIARIMQENFEWCIGQTRDEVLISSPVAAYLGHAAEPSTRDLMKVAVGRAPYAVKELQNKTMPKKPVNKDNDQKKA